MKIKVAKKFTVKKSLWAAGQGTYPGGHLLDEEGKHCCVGFYTRACGFTKKQILNEPALGDVTELVPSGAVAIALARLHARMLGSSGSMSLDIYKINDLPNGETYDGKKMTLARRIRLLKARFKVLGIEMQVEP